MLWDSRLVAVSNSWKGGFSVSAEIEDLASDSEWLITSVYGANSCSRILKLWRALDAIRGRLNGAWCVGGDWNVIWFQKEKLGGGRITSEMILFSDWINPHTLTNLQLGGASLTWSNRQTPPSMSRLDNSWSPLSG